MMIITGFIPLVSQLSIINDMKYYLFCPFMKMVIYLAKNMETVYILPEDILSGLDGSK